MLTLISRFCKIAVPATKLQSTSLGFHRPPGAAWTRRQMTIEAMTRTDWTEANLQLKDATPWEILRWSVDTFFPKLTMATAFGPEGCVILHMLAEIEPRVRVFNLET